MDVNWKIEEALMTVLDGIYLTPCQEARMQLDQTSRSRDLRRATAAALLALARRLDPETAMAAWPSDPVHRSLA